MLLKKIEYNELVTSNWKKAEYNTKTGEIEEKILDYDHGKYITT